jgi:hypothetical protein
LWPSQRPTWRLRGLRVLTQQHLGHLTGPRTRALVFMQSAKRSKASPLARAHELAGAADFQVAARDLEAVGGLGHGLEPLFARPTAGEAYSSTQTLATAPRPTRPRSWCSWLRPKRSACSITIRLALGTSTPTSITVVATSTDISPEENLAITSAFSAVGMRPCSRPTIETRQRRAQLLMGLR